MNDRPSDISETIHRYLDPELDSAERRALEEEILASDDLAAELYSLMNVEHSLSDVHLSGASRTVRSARRRSPLVRISQWALPVAAVLALLMFLPKLANDPAQPPVFRGEEGVATLEPFGPVDEPPTLYRWTAVEGAVEYRFELYDLDEVRIHSVVTRDTTVSLGGQLLPQIDEGGMWMVVPFGPGGVELSASDPAWFTVLGP